jgi:hypothetical protein
MLFVVVRDQTFEYLIAEAGLILFLKKRIIVDFIFTSRLFKKLVIIPYLCHHTKNQQ